jgi:uncharacterized protein YigE (DUF2233 family)
MSIGRASFGLLSFLLIASLLFINSTEREKGVFGESVDVHPYENVTYRKLQIAIDSFETKLIPWETILDSLESGIKDSIKIERSSTQEQLKIESLVEELGRSFVVSSTSGKNYEFGRSVYNNLALLGYLKESFNQTKRLIVSQDSTKSKTRLDSLNLKAKGYKTEIDDLENVLKRQLNMRIYKGSDSLKKRREDSSLWGEIRKKASEAYELDKSQKATTQKISDLSARLQKARNDSVSMHQIVSKSSELFDSLILSDNLPEYIFRIRFHGSRYRVFIADARKHSVQIHPNETGALAPLERVWSVLSKSDQEPILVCNAGMYNEDGSPVGLCISKGRTISKLNEDNTRVEDNFHMYPNGVFFLDSSMDFRVESTISMKQILKEKTKVTEATQSGPMLLIDGKIHPSFLRNSSNLNIRNGVGVIKGAWKSRCVFVISDEPVNFYEFSSLFKYVFRGQNALYLDGAISKMYGFEESGLRGDRGGNLGPVLSVKPVYKKTKSKISDTTLKKKS